MKTPSILVVDDSPENLKLLSILLEFEGYETVKARDAQEAQEALSRCLPDLLLIDVALPGIDGLTLTKMLRADAKTKDLFIVAVTAFAMKGDREKVFAAGCDDYLAKPIDTRIFPEQVRDWLQLAKRGDR